MNYLLMRKTTLLGFVFLSQVMFSNTFAQSSGSNGSMLNKLSTAEIKKGWKLF